MSGVNLYNSGIKFQSFLPAFHNHVKKTFTVLDKQSPIFDLSCRVVGITFAIALYPTFTLSYFIGSIIVAKSGYLDEIDRRVSDQLNQILSADAPSNETLRKKIIKLNDGTSLGQQKTIDTIRKARYSNPERELNRLKQIGILTEERNARLDKALTGVRNGYLLSPAVKQQIKITYSQALEIKEIYKNTHHVFIHAQSTQWAIFSHLVKEFIKTSNPSMDVKHFKFIRTPEQQTNSFFNYFYEFFNEWFGSKKITSVQGYLQTKDYNNPSFDDDKEVRANLLSTDAFFFNNQACESAMDFLANNSNIMNSPDVITKLIKEAIIKFAPNLRNEEFINKSCQKILASTSTAALCGNLFVICIPKSSTPHEAYRSHPFGNPCNCYDKILDEQVLEMLQADKMTPAIACKVSCRIPQFRIYTPTLKPNSGKKIFLITPFTKAQRKTIKAPIKLAVRELNEMQRILG